MSTVIKTAGALVCALALFYVAPALAQVAPTPAPVIVTPPITVTPVPFAYGDMIVAILEMFRSAAYTAAVGAVAWVVLKLPSAVSPFVKMFFTEQMLQSAINFAFSTVENAVKGQVVNVATGNALVDSATTYVVAHAPTWLINWLGGESGIKDRIIARMNVGSGSLALASDTLQSK